MQAMQLIVPMTERMIEIKEMMKPAVLIPPVKPLPLDTIERMRPATARPIPSTGTQRNTIPAIARIRPMRACVYPAGFGAAVEAPVDPPEYVFCCFWGCIGAGTKLSGSE